MSASQKRITQRAPQSCVQCTKRKLRCSKAIPCSNCIDRGMSNRCHREAVILSSSEIHRRGKVERRSTSKAERRSATRAIGGPSLVQSLERVQSPTPSNASNDVQYRSTNDGDLAIEAAISLESLAWGAGAHQTSNSNEWHSPLSTVAYEIDRLIDRRRILDILDFHQKRVAWMHNVIYMPVFIKECQQYLAGLVKQDTAWLSLYSAVLCTSVYYMGEDQHHRLGLQDGYCLSQRLFKLTMDSLANSDFMTAQSVYSMQAICVILLCAHVLGYVYLFTAIIIHHPFQMS